MHDIFTVTKALQEQKLLHNFTKFRIFLRTMIFF